MDRQPNALDPALIDRIFTRMLVRYGAQWLRMFDGVDEKLLRADWAFQLAMFSASTVDYVLDHLPPDRPPNAAQFRVLANNRPPPTFRRPRLAGPPPDPAAMARVMAEAARVRAELTDPKRISPSTWDRLRDADRAGAPLTIAQRDMMARAMQVPTHNHEVLLGEFRGIDPEKLPPAMKAERRKGGYRNG